MSLDNGAGNSELEATTNTALWVINHSYTATSSGSDGTTTSSSSSATSNHSSSLARRNDNKKTVAEDNHLAAEPSKVISHSQSLSGLVSQTQSMVNGGKDNRRDDEDLTTTTNGSELELASLFTATPRSKCKIINFIIIKQLMNEV